MPKTATISTFECSVCCSDLKETSRIKKISCIGCEYTVCSNCQKQYGKTKCMNCHARFTSAFAISNLGITFTTQTARQNVLKELMTIQKTELETVGELVEWTKICREIQKNYRFGIEIITEVNGITRRNILPTKPLRSQITQILCQCPINDCRGSIISEICNICSTVVCTECLCVKAEQHTCDPNIVESVKDIRANTKPCPKCRTLINKTEGCDHMNCTYCNTHFSWEHGNILSSSTNYHYMNRLIHQNRNIRGETAEDNTNPDNIIQEQICAVSLEFDRIPESVIRELISTHTDIPIDEAILENLYSVTKAVRYLKRSEYAELTISANSREKYDELQVKYAMNEITEKSWEQYVYKTHIKQQCYELISGILFIYIANMDGFQSELFHGLNRRIITEEFLSDLKERINNLTDIINDNIREIRDEYDPTNINLLVIRKIGDTSIGYCSKQKINKAPKKVKETRKSDILENIVLISEGQPENQEQQGQELRQQKEIQLYEYQTEHVERLESFLKTYHFGIDLSPLGTGKTYTAAKIFQNLKFQNIISVSPPSVKTKWLEVNDEYSLNCNDNLTYGEITGKRFINPKCGYLIRNDFKVPVLQEDGTTRMIDKYNYVVTKKFKDLVNNGLLLVLDEFQYLKNESAQTEACEMMIKCIYDNFRAGGKSRVLLLSGSPIDKENQAVRLFKTLGIMRHDKIVSGFQYAGINEIEDYINENFKDYPKNIPTRNSFIYYYRASYISSRLDSNGNQQLLQVASRCILYAYRLFINVIKPYVSSTMNLTQIQNTGITLHKFNGYFRLNDEANQVRIDQAVNELSRVSDLRLQIRNQPRNNTQNQNQNQNGSIMAGIVRALTIIETSKINTFHRLAVKNLEFDPNKKVVIGVNYSATITDLAALLATYNPLIIDGSKSVKSRRGILAKFQAPTSEYRVLIGNIAVISTGIDLDDKHGEYPRVCYVSPNYNTIHIYQLGHRFLRGMDTKTDTEIFMVYSNNRFERRIMESLMAKGQIMKSVGREQSEAGIAFPCDYEAYEEPDE